MLKRGLNDLTAHALPVVIITFDSFKTKTNEICLNKISDQKLFPHERIVIRIVEDWVKAEKKFTFKTSGSTGRPKTIDLEREKIEWSCRATMAKIDPAGHFKTSFLCLDPAMIGGAMVVFRSLIHNLDLRVVGPSSDPFAAIHKNERYDLVSLVPLQLYRAKVSDLDRFAAILVGGASLHNHPNASKAKIYSTFGMTETVSHFAVKEAHADFYECIGDVRLIADADSQLTIVGTITDHKPLQTSDIVEVISPTRFKWIARADFVINSGGIKIHPEIVERKLAKKIDRKFIFSSLPDDELGSRLILIIEGRSGKGHVDLSDLPGHEKPKEIYYLDRFPMTRSGKIDRMATRSKLMSSMS